MHEVKTIVIKNLRMMPLQCVGEFLRALSYLTGAYFPPTSLGWKRSGNNSIVPLRDCIIVSFDTMEGPAPVAIRGANQLTEAVGWEQAPRYLT